MDSWPPMPKTKEINVYILSLNSYIFLSINIWSIFVDDRWTKSNLDLQLCWLVQVGLGKLDLLQYSCHLWNIQSEKPMFPHDVLFDPCCFHSLSQILTISPMKWCTFWWWGLKSIMRKKKIHFNIIFIINLDVKSIAFWFPTWHWRLKSWIFLIWSILC